jgi:hypothetical protein
MHQTVRVNLDLTLPQLYQGYAVPFDLPVIKLLCLHVSEHRDESVVRPIWNQLFDESMSTVLFSSSNPERQHFSTP